MPGWNPEHAQAVARVVPLKGDERRLEVEIHTPPPYEAESTAHLTSA
jgi:hypothetical protein